MKFYFCTENQDTKFCVKNFKEALYIIKQISENYEWYLRYKHMTLREFTKNIKNGEYGDLRDTHVLWWLAKNEYTSALSVKKELNDKHTNDYVDGILK